MTPRCSRCGIEMPGAHKCGYCSGCNSAYQAVYRRENKERIAAWWAANPDKKIAYSRSWDKANASKRNEIRANYQAARLRATPKWADRSVMREIYTEAKRLTKAGEPHHVDHIVPLDSPLVCGLHCPANLAPVRARENQSKGNRRWPDMPQPI